VNRPPQDTRGGAFHVPIAGLLGWLLPGAGHLFIGERVRGIIFLAVIAVTFWTGVAIGGVKNTVNPHERSLWFLGQIGAGSHTLGVLAWSRQMAEPAQPGSPDRYAYGRAEEVSVVYTAICGMLNILIIFDVLVRAENRPLAAARVRGSSRAPGSATP
jgi:hypothetical protein